MTEIFTYIPGTYSDKQGPLARFLPPVPEGVASTWLRASIRPGALVLDPFGSSPQLAIEAARAGWRLIVTANNPIAHFLLTSLANPPTETELRIAIADLAATFKGQERLEPHLRSLYITTCENCSHEVEAEAYIWDRDTNTPFAKQYSCPYCGETAVQPTSEQDKNLAAQFAVDKLHRARALERVASLDDPDRHHVEEALGTYQPRALYALFTLLNRLDSMDLSPARRGYLEMLLLSVSDMTNSLWAYPGGRSRPKQLSLSPKFYENNVWLALERAIQEWVSWQETEYPLLSITTWPELPPSQGGISIYEGRLKDLVGELQHTDLQAVICAMPRPNQAYWTLSALWTGWLWGRDAVRPLKSVLHRRRYDWNWHTIALHSIFENLSRVLGIEIPIFGIIGEAEPGFLTSTIVAADMAGLSLEGFAFRAESGQAQIVWRSSQKEDKRKNSVLQDWDSLIAQSAQEYLVLRAEPASYLQMNAAALLELTQKVELAGGSSAPDVEINPSEIYNKVTASVERALTYHTKLKRLGGSGKSLEAGQWWTDIKAKIDGQANLPLADRVETEILYFLLEHPGSKLLDVDRHICSIFPGLLTPGGDLVHTCVDSYATQNPKGSDLWYIRAEDDPAARQPHVSSIRQLLIDIANRLQFSVSGALPLIWKEPGGEYRYIFYILATAAFGELIQTCPYPAEKSIIVIPGSRANLANLKLKNNLHLSQIFALGWRFLKFRHVYRLLESPLLNRENVDAQLALDPLQDTTQQMRLL